MSVSRMLPKAINVKSDLKKRSGAEKMCLRIISARIINPKVYRI